MQVSLNPLFNFLRKIGLKNTDPSSTEGSGTGRNADQVDDIQQARKMKIQDEIEQISGSGTWTINPETKIVILSTNAAKILGLAPENVRTDYASLVGCIHPDDRNEFSIAVSRLSLKRPDFYFEHRIVVDESDRIVQQKGKLFQDGATTEIIGSLFDVTTLRKNEIRLALERESALEASRHKSQFLASMSHEIRTPMTSVLGFAELITNPKSRPENIGSYVDTIIRNGRHLLVIIDDILDLSKVEAGHLRFNTTRISPRSLFTETLENIQSQALKKGISFEVSFAEDIPDEMITDPTRFSQIINNVLGNAIKFTDHGVIRISIEQSVSRSNKPGIRIIVEDMGKGISPEFNRLLFRPYSAFELEKSRRKTGTGLGLALARALAVAMEGEVELLSSIEEVGSKFGITMHSLTDEHQAGMQQPLENFSIPIDLLGAGPLLKDRKILITEDNKDIQEILKKIVRDAGAETSVANNGAECLEKNATTDFDMILMDLQMPVMDGFETMERLRESGYKRPIIVVTAYALNNERERCLKAGCTDFISKPINADALLKTLVRHRNL